MIAVEPKTVWITQADIVCRRHFGVRMAIGAVGLLIGLASSVLCLYLWPAPGELADRSLADFLFLLSVTGPLVVIVGFIALIGIFLYYAGPSDLVVDTSRRTYRFRRGFPLLAAWQTGTLDDVLGIQMKTTKSQQRYCSEAFLVWKNTPSSALTIGDGPVASRRPFQLGASPYGEDLTEEAVDLAERMQIPFLMGQLTESKAREESVARLIGLPFVAVLLIFGLLPLQINQSLAFQGRDTTGVVKRLSGGGSVIHYAYQVGGHLFRGNTTMERSTGKLLDVGDTVQVRYLPAYPHTNTVISSQDARQARFMAFIALASAVAMGTPLLWKRRSA